MLPLLTQEHLQKVVQNQFARYPIAFIDCKALLRTVHLT